MIPPRFRNDEDQCAIVEHVPSSAAENTHEHCSTLYTNESNQEHEKEQILTELTEAKLTAFDPEPFRLHTLD